MVERLIQEDYLDNPWRMMVSCILLNQTSNKQVRPILDDFFKLAPDPKSCISLPESKIASVIRKTGFQNVKARRIIKMSEKWLSGFKEPSELPGIGKYGSDSWSIFIDRRIPPDVSDKKLILYINSLI